MFTLPSVNFVPYQAGAPNSLIAPITLDPATDTQFILPISGMYQNQVVYASGIIVLNENNDVGLTINAGPLNVTIQPFTRDYILLDKNVATQLSITIGTAKVNVLLYIGTPPISTQILNYFGANQATQSILAANFLGNMSPIINSGFTEFPQGTVSSSVAGVYGPEGWMLKGGSATSTVFQQAIGGVFPVYYGACVQRVNGSGDLTTIQLGTAVTTVDSAQFQGQLVTVSYDLEIGAGYTASQFVANLVYGSGIDQNIFAPFSGQTTIGTQTVSVGPGFQWKRQTFTASAIIPTTATQVGIIFSYTPGTAAGANDSFTISRLQFDIGATAQLYRAVPQIIEHQRCLAFFEPLNKTSLANQFFCSGSISSSTTATFVMPYVVKRAKPTAIFGGNFTVQVNTGPDPVNAYPATPDVEIDHIAMTFGLSVATTPGIGAFLLDGGSGVGQIYINARM